MTGILTMSMEVELAWGVHDHGTYERLSPGGRAERAYLDRLLAECDDRSLPITFDVVGHLYLADCDGSHRGPHEPDWFAADPGSDTDAAPLFYAPDAVQAIRSAPTDHELCTHTFSHALLGEVSPETVAWELRQAGAIHREHDGEAPVSLVPPRHQLPARDLLTEHGIRVVRPAMPRQSGGDVDRFKQLLAGPQPLSSLRRVDGVVETTCTTYPSLTAAALPSGQRDPGLPFSAIPESIRRALHLRKLKRATRAAVERDAHLHLWCHLFDLANEPQWRTVRAYLQWLDEYRRDAELQVARMTDLPTHV